MIVICEICRTTSEVPYSKTIEYPNCAPRSGGQKFDADKPRMDLIDAEALTELAKVLTFGAKKYADENWRKGLSLRRLLAAAFRHLLAIMRGEDQDEETGLPHAAHLMCCAMFLIWTMRHRPNMDDRYKYDIQAPAMD